MNRGMLCFGADVAVAFEHLTADVPCESLDRLFVHTRILCTISVAFASIASAQTYTTIDYPGAIATTLNGGPNPQGTSVGVIPTQLVSFMVSH